MVMLAWVAVTSALVLALRWVDPPTTAFMLAARLLGEPVVYEWMPWRELPQEMALAVVAAEDQRFPHHSGFDFVEIFDAVETVIAGGRLRGASTITQQVAKNLFLWADRSFLRKGLEAYFTVLLESFWTKRRILEVYLNVAQFGPRIYGVSAASEAWFDRPPAALSRYQMSLLAATLPDPDDLKPDAPGPELRERAAFVREHMSSLGGTSYLQGI